MYRLVDIVWCTLLISTYSRVLTVQAQCDPESLPMLLSGNGSFSLPNNSITTPVSACEWLISDAQSFGTVALTVNEFFSTSSCCDILRFYDGSSRNAPVIAEIYGTPSMPLFYSTTQRYALVGFNTRNTVPTYLFTVSFITTSSGCTSLRPALIGGNGLLSSPDYPNNYGNSADCQWILQANFPNDIVVITFTSFNTESCCDFVYVHDGNSPAAVALATLSGSQRVPFNISTTQQYMLIRFRTDDSVVSNGFSAEFHSIQGACTAGSGLYNQTGIGYLFSPNHPRPYYNNGDCQWRLSGWHSYSIIILKFTAFNTTIDCCDFVRVYDGNSSDSQLIVTLSGTPSVPVYYVSTQQHMLVTFTTDSTETRRGFAAMFYSSEPCCTTAGRPKNLTGDGIVSSPNYPFNYHDDANCQWRITSTFPYGIVRLIITHFQTQSGSDVLEVYNGFNTTSSVSPQLARLSGQLSVPRTYSTTQAHMYMRFYTSSSVNDTGFTATYTSIKLNDCYSSPCLNGGTCNDLDFGYSCTCSVGFEGTHCQTNVDDCASSPCMNGAICDDDVNGYHCRCQGGYTGTLCETEIDECASLPCYNEATCTDVINGFVCTCLPGYFGNLCANETDYCAEWPCLNKGTCINYIGGFTCLCDTGFTGLRCETDVDACMSIPCQNGATCQDLTDGFNCTCAPGFDGNYCETNINECASLPCQNGATCRDEINDFACICDLDYTGVYCETAIDQCASSPCENDATCVDGVAEYFCICPDGYTGYNCESRIVSTPAPDFDNPCSPDSRPLNLTGFGGLLTSRNFPFNYDDNSDCHWLITAMQENGTVSLEFGIFNTELCCDILFIYDGPTVKSPLIQTLSGQYNPPPARVNSTQRYMYIRFLTDDTDTDRGFYASYASVASGDACSPDTRPLRLQGDNGIFRTTNYPNNYFTDADCQWIITSSNPFGIINLVFLDFDTEACCDFVYIFDGNNLKAPLIVSLSGSNPTAEGGYNTTQQNMFIRFASDSTITARGFTASYTSVGQGTPGDACSPETRPLDLTLPSGTFSSINYPYEYTNNADCQWRITALDTTGIVSLTFIDFDTEACCDFVFVYNGDSIKSPLRATLSGTSPTGSQYNSTQQYLYLRLSTDDTITSRGFNAQFQSTKLRDPCSPDTRPQDLIGATGIFSSANYPNNYDDSGDCQWRIAAADAGQILVLDFDDFATESCCDFVKIYDGDSTKTTLLTTLSGTYASLPGGIRSTQRYMYVWFTSDSSLNARGFRARFRSESPAN